MRHSYMKKGDKIQLETIVKKARKCFRYEILHQNGETTERFCKDYCIYDDALGCFIEHATFYGDPIVDFKNATDGSRSEIEFIREDKHFTYYKYEWYEKMNGEWFFIDSESEIE